MSDKKRIMLIDNEEGLCRMMEAVLRDNGFAVKAHTRSFEAVEEFAAGQWDLVVTDIKMPGMDGLEVLQRVKAKEPSIPVIMITAYATVEMSIQALRKGAYDMLTKPFEPEELLYRVKNALQHTMLLEENKVPPFRVAPRMPAPREASRSPSRRSPPSDRRGRRPHRP